MVHPAVQGPDGPRRAGPALLYLPGLGQCFQGCEAGLLIFRQLSSFIPAFLCKFAA